MEMLNISLSIQETPVDLSINRSSRISHHPISFTGTTMVIPNPSKFQNSDNFPHMRFHSNHHSPSEIEVAQNQCNELDACDINSAISNAFDSPKEEQTISVRSYEITPRRDEVRDTSFTNKKYDIPTGGSSDSKILPTYPQDSTRISHKRKLIEDSLIEDTTVRKRQKVHKIVDTAGALYNKYPYGYFYDYLRRTSEPPPSVDPYHPRLHPLDNSSIGAYLQQAQPSSQETESLLAAVQHSQMLYYSYCNQLLQNLQSKRQTPGVNKQPRNINETTQPPLRKKQDEKILQSKSVEPKSSHSTPIPGVDRTSSSSPNSPSGEQQATEVDSRTSSGRKRAPRALTGKHVRPGTGASLSTLLSLREKIAKRRRDGEEDVTTNDDVSNLAEKSTTLTLSSRIR